MDKKEMFFSIEKAIMDDEKPSDYLNSLLSEGKLEDYPFSMLSGLTGVEQNLKYHPEGSVWNHTMLVVDEASKRKVKSRNPRAFMWAALLHDIGKKPTTKVRKGRITSYNHESVGKKMAVEFLREFVQDEKFIEDVASFIRWHMEPLFIIKELPFSNIKGLVNDVPYEEVALLAVCDRFGRGDMSVEKMRDEEKGIEMFVEKCRQYRS